MRTKFICSALLHSILICCMANSFGLIQAAPWSLIVIIPAFLLVNIFAGTLLPRIPSKKLRICRHGTVMLYAFYVSILLTAVYQIFFVTKTDTATFIWNLVVCIAVHFIVFWNGILCVYFTSTQLGLKWRVIGLIFGMVPVANLIVLFIILKITIDEQFFETEKLLRNQQRAEQKVCATKYPILLVHGVFFRDFKLFNYWGRIPKELEQNGAAVYYGNHSSAASIADSAAELKERIGQILRETGAEKVNIIAHSKGGLDCRYAMAKLDMTPYVASLTTVNTPHRGCLYAEYLLNKIPDHIQNKVAEAYNTALSDLGDPKPDFLAAVNDLTDSYCNELNEEMPTPEGVYCQSVGSVLMRAVHGRFPLNVSYHLVKHFDGENDGLVSETAFAWGEKYTLLKPTGKRGISHSDMIDLSRENIPDFDVREFYVGLVSDLKERGL